MTYRIFIPSLGRVDRQTTWDNLSIRLQSMAVIVCPPDEVEPHTRIGRQAMARPVSGIANVRQWIADQCDQPFVMLDDDLRFYVRKSPDAHNLTPADPAQVRGIIEGMLSDLEGGWAAVGLSPRQHNNAHFPRCYIEVAKQNAVHGFDPVVLRKHNIRFNDVELMEDYHVVLSLLEAGHPNRVKVDAAWDQTGKSGAPGGASTYRTPDMQTKAAHRLHQLHPDVVQVVVKEPKQAWGDGQRTRTDVRISWRKAYTG